MTVDVDGPALPSNDGGPHGPYVDFLSVLRRSTNLLNEDPIRLEIFGVERLEQYATHLAVEFQINAKPSRGRPLLPAIKQWGNQLRVAYRTLVSEIRDKHAVSPAAECFVDNFHHVEDQMREIKQNLPADYYYELPKLANGELKGYPRVYGIALAIIANTDSQLESEALKRFLNAYQKTTPLRIGELWAMASTLKIALVEHLTPLARLIVKARESREQANGLADHLLELAAQPQTQSCDLLRLLSKGVGHPDQFDRAFIVQLTQRLRDQDPDVWPVIVWLETQLKKHKTNLLKITQFELHRQAAAQVTVGNIITSMRLLSTLDWREFVETVSLVDRVLEKDPSGAYAKMDFASRNDYRHAVERIAKRSKTSEIEIAQKAVSKAEANLISMSIEGRASHIGDSLVGAGVREFEKSVHYRPRAIERISRLIVGCPTVFYMGSLTLFTTALLLPVIFYCCASGGSLFVAILFGTIAIFPASELALGLLNRYVAFWIKPKILHRMETDRGLPENTATMVIVPTLFISMREVRKLLETLHVHYLANPDPQIYFAFLGDFADASTETVESDASILKLVQDGIDELNTRYSLNTEKRFYLFHRRRQWNDTEKKWMGWERKRGKILEFNRLLRGSSDTSYYPSGADPALLAKIKYVITLDSDTQLPRDSARLLVGTIEHPLNRPTFCPNQKRVISGYGILQPRISVSMVSATRTHFARIFSGNTGLDPYTRSVSDTYQDLFGEGSYTGKGLYCVDAFGKALEGRVPENTVLSHDLFEGAYARSALVSDIELIDDYPSDYQTFSKRHHRWTRGDWQLLPWLFPKVQNDKGEWITNNLPFISRWKIFDNMRRSLVPIANLVWLILAWTILPGSPLIWTLPIVLMWTFPIYAPLTTGAFLRSRGRGGWGHFRSTLSETRIQIEQMLLMTILLVEHAVTQADAIVRTLYRILISRKGLLEWVSFGETVQRRHNGFFVGFGPPIAILVALLVVFQRPEALAIAIPFLGSWLLNPLIHHWTGRRIPNREVSLGPDQIRAFRTYARRTWHFFETFLTADDHWLAPDNFQEDPHPVIAHRTSPTNVGLQLLSISAALDFGYIGVLEFIELLEKTFLTLGKLQRLNGHLFNWYDTQTLAPLNPQYVSTVDSGNLCGHLLTLKQACLEISRRPNIVLPSRDGLLDTLYQVRDEVRKVVMLSQSSTTVTLNHLLQAIDAILEGVRVTAWSSLEEWSEFLTTHHLNMVDAEDILNALAAGESATTFSETRIWWAAALRQIREFQRDVRDLEASDACARLNVIMKRCDDLVLGMDFRFLFDESRKVFVIGFNVTQGKLDNSYYDLLASESRLASFVAIAKGDVPKEHWFRLGRQITSVHGGRALIAWTATMFEYLMPLLIMRRYANTILDQTYASVVKCQIAYGKQHKVPWGISEAGYHARDLHLYYQYAPFGIPGLGLKRGLSGDLVISPYSTMLAAMIVPLAALDNLQRLEQLGVFSRYGFFESIDYTPDRLPKNKKNVIIRSFMAHHQGMSLVALDNLLNEWVMQKRFHADPLVKATQLLLQERIPLAVALQRPRAEEVHASADFLIAKNPIPVVFLDVHLPTPRTQLLSNGTYTVMVTTTGAGYSRCGRLDVSRWREDVTRDHCGQWFYIRNCTSGHVWSAAFQPIGTNPKAYEATFTEDKVEFLRRDGKIVTHTEIIVSPEDNVELRRISLSNKGTQEQVLEVTSFMEVVFALSDDDAAHPAFSNLFVQTEFFSTESTLLATRRRRSEKDPHVWGFHVLVTEGERVDVTQCETDRARFLGRGRTAQDPLVIHENRPLSNTVGSVLDPIFSLRETVRIPAGETVRITFATGMTSSREEAFYLTEKYRNTTIFAREADIAWTKSQVTLRHLNISTHQAHSFQRLAGRLIYSDPSLRPGAHVLALNTQTQSSLWGYGISGDLPIILARISDEKDILMVRELLHAHEYLRLKGLRVDLVLLNEREPSYFQVLQDEMQRQIRMSGSQTMLDKPGGVFLRRTDLMPKPDIILLKSVARVALSAEKGTLDEQLRRRSIEIDALATLKTKGALVVYPEWMPTVPKLKFFNGIGGFTEHGHRYVIQLKEGQWTPAPWINVIANACDFGFLVSEAGSGYTWSINSRENRLTSWNNDAVSDGVSEAIYIRDDESGAFWSPTPLPIRESEMYVIQHGQGFTQFDHISHGIEQELLMFVPLDATVKISRLRLKNRSSVSRHLSVTTYTEWVLGVQRSHSAPHVITEVDKISGTLFARNAYNNEFSSRVAFSDISEVDRSFTCDRKEFLGRNGSPAHPAALLRGGLGGRHGAGLDPCAAFQASFTLAPGEERTVIVLLGEAATQNEALALAQRYRSEAVVREAYEQVLRHWESVLGTIEIKTPDPAMNMLVNRWLIYQTLSCRVWARSAFYQSGGGIWLSRSTARRHGVGLCETHSCSGTYLESL